MLPFHNAKGYLLHILQIRCCSFNEPDHRFSMPL